MRILPIFFILFFSQYTLAIFDPTAKDFENKMESFIDTMTKTNSIQVLLKNHKNNLSPESYAELATIANSSPKKRIFYFAKKTSKTSFALKLKNSQWANFKINPQGGILIGDTPFNWNNKIGIKENIDAISKIMASEFGKKNKSASLTLMPKAHADETSNHTDHDAIAVGLYGALGPMFSTDIFITNIDKFCNNKPTLLTSLDKIKDIKEKFLVAKSYFEPRKGNLWGLTMTDAAYAKFDRAQQCLANKGKISEADFLPIAEEKGREAKEAEAAK